MPYDVIVVGEEHGNPAYHRLIVDSLPDLHKIGYRFFCVEQPSDLSSEANLYVNGKKTLDDSKVNKALWLMFAKLRGMGVPRNIPQRSSPFAKNDRIVASLNLITHASCLGFDVLFVDMPLSKLRMYVHQYKATGQNEEDSKSFSKMLGGVYGTLGARNKHMADGVTKGSVVVVGRAHTGETPRCVEVFLRGRGFSVLSVDLIGEDQALHEIPAESADVSITPSELRQMGGLASLIEGIKRRGFTGKSQRGGDDY